MQFEWDAEKNRTNVRKHGISFKRAMTAFEGDLLVRIDDRHDYGEVREVGLGLMHDGTLISVVYTERSGRIRLISARKATRIEQEAYYGSL